jgi:hypothetical protein
MFHRPILALIFVAFALTGLGLYSLMRQVACVEDQNTSTYCYIEAASNPDPSDLYIYSLPWTSLPNNTNMSCSDCNKNVMGLFGSQSNQVDGLKNTYNAAAKLASSKCGSTYVYTQSVIASSSALQWIGAHPPTSWTLALALCVLFIGLI